MTERHCYLLPGSSGDEGTDVYGSFDDIAASLAVDGESPRRIEITFARDKAGTTATPPKKPKYRFYYDTHLIGSDGDGSEQNPWPDVTSAMRGLVALKESGRLSTPPGNSVVVERREVFTATSLENKKRRAELIAKYIFMAMAMMLVLPVLTILGYLAYQAWPAFFPTTTIVAAADVSDAMTVRKLIVDSGGSTEVIKGIAVVGVGDAAGTWEYSTDGREWHSFATAGVATNGRDDSNAVLLDHQGRIRFVANSGGETTGGIEFRPWYNIDERIGSKADFQAQLGKDVNVEMNLPLSTSSATSAVSVGTVEESETKPNSNPKSKNYTGQLLAVDDTHLEVLVDGEQHKLPIADVKKALTAEKSGDTNVYVDPNWSNFILTNPKNRMTAGGIWAPFVGTFFLVFVSLLVSAPIGILAGVYLNEYAPDNWFTRLINLAVVNLAGVPSIVHALFGVGAFVIAASFGESLLAASCTLAVMTLPVIITSTKEALSAVPTAFRVACWNMGATRWQTIRTIVLPNSISGILTGVILQVSRAAGETAPILFTGAAFYMQTADSGYGYWVPYGLWDKIMALSMHLFTVMTQVNNAPQEIIYGTAVVLIGLVLAVNSASIMLRLYLRSRKKW